MPTQVMDSINDILQRIVGETTGSRGTDNRVFQQSGIPVREQAQN